MIVSQWLWSIDGWIVLVGILSSISAALLGNFLVLRRMSLLGDAISHAVLPGLAAAFLLSGSRDSPIMFVGAVVSGIVTALLTHWIQSHGKIDEGASMGVVFTTLFALGLILIVQAADYVDLDASCVFYGSIETTPFDKLSIFGQEIPRAVPTLLIVLTVNLIFVVLFYKELKVSSFDPALATTTGYNASILHYLLMTLVAVTTVACFESVGNILVVAMLIVPASTALLLSDRLSVVIWLSVFIAATSAFTGHVAAIVVPSWFGYRSTTTAGMMAVAGGMIFFVVSLFAPRKGVVVQWVRRWRLTGRILAEDIVAALYRFEERGQAAVSAEQLGELLMVSPWIVKLVGLRQKIRGWIEVKQSHAVLTDRGRTAAKELVRSHRLWENYLVEQVGETPDRIHNQAERLEHFTDEELQRRLQEVGGDARTDPHGREIPS